MATGRFVHVWKESHGDAFVFVVIQSFQLCPSCSLRPHACVACQAPLSMGFPRQEYWNGLPFLSPEDLPNPGSKLISGIGRQIAYHWATREALLRFTWPPQTLSTVSDTEYHKGPPFSSKCLLSKHVLLTLCFSWVHRQGMCRAASTSGDLGAEIFPRLAPANSWIHPIALQGPVSLSPHRLSAGVMLSSPKPPTLLLLRSSDSPLKASFELCMQSTDLWFGHSLYLNHFLWLSFLLNHKYLMTACKLNMGMLWTCYVEKNNLGVSDSFTASYRSPPK